MKKAHYDNTNGKILGFYDTDIHKVIPTPNIEISLEAWQNAINNSHNKINTDGSTLFQDFRTLEQVKASKLQQIEDDYNIAESQPVDIAGVFYIGGKDSVESIDAYVRLNRLAGNTTHNIWDVNGVEHPLTDGEADDVIIAIGSQASTNKFTKKNRKATLTSVALDALEADGITLKYPTLADALMAIEAI